MENAISILEIPNTDIHAYFFLHMKLRKTQLSNEYREKKSEVRENKLPQEISIQMVDHRKFLIIGGRA